MELLFRKGLYASMMSNLELKINTKIICPAKKKNKKMLYLEHFLQLVYCGGGGGGGGGGVGDTSSGGLPQFLLLHNGHRPPLDFAQTM